MVNNEESLRSEDVKNASEESKNAIQAQFDELTTLYEEMYTWPYRRDVETPNMLKVLGNVRGLSILDYGCGTGTHARCLKNAGAARVVGYDPNLQMIQYARERAISLGIEIEFASELNPDIYNGQFDIVTGVYVLPYAFTKAELTNMCSQMGRLLKPDGRLITLPIHPNINLNPDYYEEYGLRLTSQKNCDGSYGHFDGGPMEVHICYEKWDEKVIATYWSEASLTQAMNEAGFSSVSHIGLAKISSESLSPSLLNYLKQPHASLIESKK